jgi:ABC-type antimicrobial peptide transport system permease subunit
LRDRNTSFEALAAYSIGEVGLDAGDGPARVSVSGVSGNYFDVLDVQPYLGRFLHASDERGANSAPYVVLSYGFWHSHCHDDPGIVGRTVQVNKQPFTVIGVAARGFHGSASFFSPDIFVPLLNEGQIDDTGDLDVRGNRWVFQVLGHLKPGVTRAQALADLRSIGAYLQKTYPNDDAKLALSLARPSLLGSVIEHGVAAFVMALMVLAGLILLAACTNLGSLFAARTADRSRELALRLALGSSRARIMRQLFTEVILLSLAGGAIGLCLSVTLLNSLSVAALSTISAERASRTGLARLCGGTRAGGGQRISFRRDPGETSSASRSVRGGEVRRGERNPREIRFARCAARGADCDLRGAGDGVAGCGARPGAFAAQ